MNKGPKFFRLGEREKIMYEMKPVRGYLNFLLVSSTSGAILLVFLLLALVLMVGGSSGLDLSKAESSDIIWILLIVLVPVLVLGIPAIISSKLRYDKRYYWITNSRIVIKTGLIGYSINSIPLERISDVMVSRSFVESIFKISSLKIQTLSGQGGIEGRISGIDNAERLQEYIFRLVKYKRKKERLTI
jgi:uncharacterized membrane protein YdbT with pleckstrin-like domain